jgi:hypothetical protein
MERSEPWSCCRPYCSCCNRGVEAEELLREARNQGYRSAETNKLLIELLFAR